MLPLLILGPIMLALAWSFWEMTRITPIGGRRGHRRTGTHHDHRAAGRSGAATGAGLDSRLAALADEAGAKLAGAIAAQTARASLKQYGQFLIDMQATKLAWLEDELAPRPMFSGNYTKIKRTAAGGPPVVNSLPGLGAQGEIELAIEPVVAFRVFKVDVDDEYEIALRSVSYDTLWPRQAELVATCRHSLGRCGLDGSPENHESPMPGCTCGIYLTKTISKALEQASGPIVVLAVVRGWGKVVKHETGWRVQKAYPVGLAVLPQVGVNVGNRQQAAVAKLRDAYAVPVELLERTPTGDVSAEDFAIEHGWIDA